MKAVLISIRPEWCEKIVSGAKTIEIRKTVPKLATPFKCYIYCTYGQGLIEYHDPDYPNMLLGLNVSKNATRENCCNGKVIGEFVCDAIFAIESNYEIHDELAGSPLETWLEWNEAPEGYEMPEDIEKASCLTLNDIAVYTGGQGYCWHISNLEIYDTPKALSELRIPCKEYDKDNPSCGACEYYYYESNESVGFYDECCCDGLKHITRAPQSWCYVEEI